MAKPLPGLGGHTGERKVVLAIILSNHPSDPSILGGGKESFKKVTTQPSLSGKERSPSKKATTQPERGGRKQPKGGTRKPSKLNLGVGIIHRRKEGLQSQVNLHSKRMDRMVKPSSIQKGWTGWLNQAPFKKDGQDG